MDVQSQWVRLALIFGLLATASLGATSLYAQEGGQFYRLYWYEPGTEHGNPTFNSRFRVNAPETSVHPDFAYRSEARANGMMQILIEEDLRKIEGAALYLEVWGGHPGTANKRVTVNGRSTYALPEVGTERGHCTHQYPVIPLKVTDLVNGYNALQFACDKGSTFWGHFIVDNAALRLALPGDHPDLEAFGLAGFEASVTAVPVPDKEIIRLVLSVPDTFVQAVSSVDFQGYYEGYDENGNTKTTDWHGVTKHRHPVAILGTTTRVPFAIRWGVRMLPAQEDVRVRAVVRLKGHPNLVYVTSPVRGLEIPERRDVKVSLYTVEDLPRPFYSRVGKERQATIELDLDPRTIEQAELHVVVWDGGAGTVEDYFTLNGHPLQVAGAGDHDVIYTRLPIDPALLKRGVNRIQLLSDTEHHGIEVLLPGPTLIVRYTR